MQENIKKIREKVVAAVPEINLRNGICGCGHEETHHYWEPRFSSIEAHYAGCKHCQCGYFKVGEKVLDYLEEMPESEVIDANALVLRADKELDEGITGNMAGYIAMIATKCHSRGEEFRKSWNTHNGNPDSKGVVNPAIITIETNHEQKTN